MNIWIQEKARAGTLIILVVAVVLGGCAGTSKPPSFYLLGSMVETEEQAVSSKGESLSVLVGPIFLPAYLEGTQILAIKGANEVSLDEFNRWAEPLQDSFYRVLMENLSLLLSTPAVYSYDRRFSGRADFQIVVHVTRFDSDARGEACLNAFWSVFRLEEDKPSITRKSLIRKSGASAGIPGAVDAQNRALAEFSHDIATALQSLRR